MAAVFSCQPRKTAQTEKDSARRLQLAKSLICFILFWFDLIRFDLIRFDLKSYIGPCG